MLKRGRSGPQRGENRVDRTLRTWKLSDPRAKAATQIATTNPVNSDALRKTQRGTHHGPIEIVLTSRRRRLLPDTAGAVAVEYTMLLIFVALPLAAALAAGGVVMLNEYRVARDLILLPVP
jgi:Flp pilus assembly pilin Flp